jgi:hypothetical protein
MEEVALALHGAGDFRVAAARQQLGREHDGGGVVPLGSEPRQSGIHFIEALHYDGEVRLSDDLVEAHNHVARLYAVAVAHPQLPHDPAGRVLDLLDVRVDHHGARRDDRAGELCRRGKPADATGQERDDGQPAEEVAADGPLRG